MSSLQFGIPSASTSSNHRPIILPPPREIPGLQHRSSAHNHRCPHHHHHHHSQIRPSELRSSTSTSTSTPRHQPSLSSPSSRPAYSSSSRTSSSSSIPTQSATSFSHWATQDPFDFVPRPRRSVLTSWAFSNNRPSERRPPNRPLPFAPSPPTSQSGARQAPRQRPATPDNISSTSPASTASTASTVSDSEPEPLITTMPAPTRQTRKRRATNDVPSSSPSESPAPSTRSSKRRAPQRASTSSADKPEASSWREAAPSKRTAPLPRTGTKTEPAEELIVFESSDIEEDSGLKVIDLVDKDEVPEEVAEPEPKEKNTVRLGTFQCVICMDDVTDLTVTHCGMFCPLPNQTATLTQ